jgi:hypothetical protein
MNNLDSSIPHDEPLLELFREGKLPPKLKLMRKPQYGADYSHAKIKFSAGSGLSMLTVLYPAMMHMAKCNMWRFINLLYRQCKIMDDTARSNGTDDGVAPNTRVRATENDDVGKTLCELLNCEGCLLGVHRIVACRALTPSSPTHNILAQTHNSPKA